MMVRFKSKEVFVINYKLGVLDFIYQEQINGKIIARKRIFILCRKFNFYEGFDKKIYN